MSDSHNCFTIELAGIAVQIEALTLRTKFQCLQYITNKKPDVCVSVSREEVEREVQKYEAAGFVNEDKSYSYNNQHIVVHINEINEPFLESAIIYSKIAEKLTQYNVLLMHGAVIAIGGYAYMFTAHSGVGKTTHIKKWVENVKEAVVVNGDKPLIKVLDTEIIACGTPWCGKEHMGANIKAPIKAIVIMERSDDNQMEEISISEAYPYLLQQTFISTDLQAARKTLKILSQLCNKVSFYKFRFNNYKEDCFLVSYNTLIKDL